MSVIIIGRAALALSALALLSGCGLSNLPAIDAEPGANFGVAAAYSFNATTMVVKADGSLWASGGNGHGQLGDGSTAPKDSLMLIMAGVKSVACGEHHTLVVKNDGSLWAMGQNNYGQLGDNTTASRSVPVKIWPPGSATGPPVVLAAAGLGHSLFLCSDGSLWAMGLDTSGQLLDGGGANKLAPKRISIDGKIRKISAGAEHTLVLKDDDTIYAAGRNNDGQLGDGSTTTRAGLFQWMAGAKAVFAKDLQAGYNNSFIIKADGSLWACGLDTSGQLGNGASSNLLNPTQVMQGVSAIRANHTNTLVLKADATLWAMGANGSGELGDGTTTGRSVPTRIAHGVASICAGRNYGIFVRRDGSLWGMGLNSSGQLGDGTGATKSAGPVQIGF
jgi:alpha-tubulin suppressor-like RCC1 family protein